jgi:hypothetical protein
MIQNQTTAMLHAPAPLGLNSNRGDHEQHIRTNARLARTGNPYLWLSPVLFRGCGLGNPFDGALVADAFWNDELAHGI